MSYDELNEPDPSMMPDGPDGPTAPVLAATFATRGEADVAQAKLRDAGVDSIIDDQIEGGTVPVDGEPGVHLAVRAEDAAIAAQVLGI